jgi:hypothetical protein
MKTMKHFGIAAAFVLLASFSFATEAHAAGVALDGAALPAAARTELTKEIARANAEVPELVKQVRDLAAHARDLDQGSRLPGAPLTMHLKPLGPRAFGPMVELLVFDAHAAKDLSGTAQIALRLGLIEAIGIIRDARAIPVFAHLLDARGTDFDTQRAAAEGLARIGTDDALAVLKTSFASARGGEHERAILSGLHDARREAAAKLLVAKLDAADTDEATAKIAAKSLGGVGNAWAWKTVSHARSEEAATRALAARGLVKAYVRFTGEARDQAAKSLLVVDDPSTSSLVAEAKKTANADTLRALTALEQRLAKNPTH